MFTRPRSSKVRLGDIVGAATVMILLAVVALWALDGDRLWYYLNAYAQLWLSEW
jgi:hypothetical protein